MTQQLAALSEAKDARRAKARVRAHLNRLEHARALRSAARLVANHSPLLGALSVGELLFSLPHVGPSKTRSWSQRVGVDPLTKVRELDSEQRWRLVEVLLGAAGRTR